MRIYFYLIETFVPRQTADIGLSRLAVAFGFRCLARLLSLFRMTVDGPDYLVIDAMKSFLIGNSKPALLV